MARVLLAEDEVVSRRYLRDALDALGHECAVVGDGHAALEHARLQRYDLLLLDYNLPGRRGDEVLAALRSQRDAASHAAPAIALTADHDDGVNRRLLASGFARVAHKPIALSALAALLDAQVGAAVVQHWDDAAALRTTGGAREIVASLRTLMLAELPQQRSAVVEAIGRDQPATALETLHRLRAACGFCGAAALAQRVDALEAALRVGAADVPLAAFLAEVDTLLG